MSYNSLAHAYANKFGKTPEEITRIYHAVLHGQTLTGLKRDKVSDPVMNAGYNYAMSFKDLPTEEKFRLQEAVRYGATIPAENTNSVVDDNTLMPFGMHKGKAMANVPAHYLLWLLDEGCSHSGVKQYILTNLEGLKKEAGKSKVRY
jgi:uncharacterized protein (DUF3820 family)